MEPELHDFVEAPTQPTSLSVFRSSSKACRPIAQICGALGVLSHRLGGAQDRLAASSPLTSDVIVWMCSRLDELWRAEASRAGAKDVDFSLRCQYAARRSLLILQLLAALRLIDADDSFGAVGGSQDCSSISSPSAEVLRLWLWRRAAALPRLMKEADSMGMISSSLPVLQQWASAALSQAAWSQVHERTRALCHPLEEYWRRREVGQEMISSVSSAPTCSLSEVQSATQAVVQTSSLFASEICYAHPMTPEDLETVALDSSLLHPCSTPSSGATRDVAPRRLLQLRPADDVAVMVAAAPEASPAPFSSHGRRSLIVSLTSSPPHSKMEYVAATSGGSGNGVGSTNGDPPQGSRGDTTGDKEADLFSSDFLQRIAPFVFYAPEGSSQYHCLRWHFSKSTVLCPAATSSLVANEDMPATSVSTMTPQEILTRLYRLPPLLVAYAWLELSDIREALMLYICEPLAPQISLRDSRTSSPRGGSGAEVPPVLATQGGSMAPLGSPHCGQSAVEAKPRELPTLHGAGRMGGAPLSCTALPFTARADDRIASLLDLLGIAALSPGTAGDLKPGFELRLLTALCLPMSSSGPPFWAVDASFDVAAVGTDTAWSDYCKLRHRVRDYASIMDLCVAIFMAELYRVSCDVVVESIRRIATPVALDATAKLPFLGRVDAVVRCAVNQMPCSDDRAVPLHRRLPSLFGRSPSAMSPLSCLLQSVLELDGGATTALAPCVEGWHRPLSGRNAAAFLDDATVVPDTGGEAAGGGPSWVGKVWQLWAGLIAALSIGESAASQYWRGILIPPSTLCTASAIDHSVCSRRGDSTAMPQSKRTMRMKEDRLCKVMVGVNKWTTATTAATDNGNGDQEEEEEKGSSTARAAAFSLPSLFQGSLEDLWLDEQAESTALGQQEKFGGDSSRNTAETESPQDGRNAYLFFASPALAVAVALRHPRVVALQAEYLWRLAQHAVRPSLHSPGQEAEEFALRIASVVESYALSIREAGMSTESIEEVETGTALVSHNASATRRLQLGSALSSMTAASVGERKRLRFMDAAVGTEGAKRLYNNSRGWSAAELAARLDRTPVSSLIVTWRGCAAAPSLSPAPPLSLTTARSSNEEQLLLTVITEILWNYSKHVAAISSSMGDDGAASSGASSASVADGQRPTREDRLPRFSLSLSLHSSVERLGRLFAALKPSPKSQPCGGLSAPSEGTAGPRLMVQWNGVPREGGSGTLAQRQPSHSGQGLASEKRELDVCQLPTVMASLQAAVGIVVGYVVYRAVSEVWNRWKEICCGDDGGEPEDDAKCKLLLEGDSFSHRAGEEGVSARVIHAAQWAFLQRSLNSLLHDILLPLRRLCGCSEHDAGLGAFGLVYNPISRLLLPSVLQKFQRAVAGVQIDSARLLHEKLKQPSKLPWDNPSDDKEVLSSRDGGAHQTAPESSMYGNGDADMQTTQWQALHTLKEVTRTLQSIGLYRVASSDKN